MSGIVIDRVSKRFEDPSGKSITALKEIEQSVPDGAFVSIVGPSGCGKSTLLAILAGLERPSNGSVQIGNRTVTKPDPRTGIIFQEDSALPWRTVIANVKFGMLIAGAPRDHQELQAAKMIELVGLQGFEDAYPAKLSGGMRQRVAIARTLALEPEVLLMDEPFGALDPQTRLMIGREVRRIWKRTGTTVVFVTHDIQEAIMLAEQVWVMSYRPGQIIDTIDVTLPDERDLDALSTPDFNRISNRIWESIRAEVMKGFNETSRDG